MHALRGTVDAVIAGVGTVLADDPQLTARNLRDGSLAIRQPLRVVVDCAGRTPADARVRDGAAPTWIATADEVGAGPDGRVDLRGAARGAVRARASARCCWRAARPWPARSCAPAWSTRSSATSRRSCSAPARPRWSTPASTTIAEAIDLELIDVTQIGPDLRITALPRKGRAEMFTGIVEELGEVVRGRADGGRLGAARRTRPAGHRPTPGTATRSRSTASA